MKLSEAAKGVKCTPRRAANGIANRTSVGVYSQVLYVIGEPENRAGGALD